MIIINEKLITIKAYSIGELADIYEVDYRTLKKWLKPFEKLIGERIGRFYSVKQVIIIFDNIKRQCKGIIEDNGNGYYIDENNTIRPIAELKKNKE